MSLSISFIIPAYNSEKDLQHCLDFLYASLSLKDEVIVINDGSTDRTQEIIERNECRNLKLNKNQGAAHARNCGARLSDKDLLIFMDSDILIDSKDVESIRKYFQEHPEVHTTTSSLSSSLKKTGFFTNFKNIYMEFITSHKVVSVNYVYGAFCATRRKTFIPWPEQYRLTEDSLWGFTQKKNGMMIHSLDHIKPTHLKTYTLLSLAKNDFLISSYFARSFLENNRWNTLYGNEKFGHIKKNQKVSVLLSVVALLATLVNLNVGLSLVGIWVILNFSFFNFIFKKRNLSFMFKSIAWYYFDCIIYFTGILYGFSQCLREKSKSRLREVT